MTERDSDSLLMKSGAAEPGRPALSAQELQETCQSITANEVLLEMAASYERRRAPHMTRSIYERLLTDETR